MKNYIKRNKYMKEIKDDLIEMITVRLNTCGGTHAFLEILKDLMESSEHSSTHDSIKLYKSELVENDWAIYLNSPVIEKDGRSSLATNLAEALRSVGLVHHKLWRSCDPARIDALLNR